VRFTAWAPVIFRDTLKENIELLRITPGQTLGDYFGTAFRVPCVSDWVIHRQAILWIPAFLTRAQERSIDALKAVLAKPAADYKCLITLHVRINGASAVFWEWKQIAKTMPPQEFRVAQEKVKRFIDHHTEAVKCVDNAELLPDPSDSAIEEDEDMLSMVQVTSMGRTDYLEDVDCMKTQVRTIPGRSRMPLQVIKDECPQPVEGVFLMGTESALEKLSSDIRDNVDDASLQVLYVGEESQTAFEFYNPMPMKNAAQCREYSMLLACITMINLCWKRVQDTELSLSVRHAFHCYMGAFVPLMYHAIMYPVRSLRG
jgi:hypothetical protein